MTNKQTTFYNAIQNNFIKEFNDLLHDERIDLAFDKNWAICIASDIGNIYMVKTLLLKKNVTPSDDDNWAIRHADRNEHKEIVKLLWQTEDVRKTLKNNDLKLYKKLVQEELQNKIIQF
jgi:hypothetical protein